MPKTYHKIILPVRPQPDTIIAIFILQRFGKERFVGIENATIESWSTLPHGDSEQTLDEEGVLLIDIGGGKFDHHTALTQTTAADLVAAELGVQDDPALAKLIEYARRDDFFGKGTISEDQLDRTFGLTGLISNLNKEHSRDPHYVVSTILPLIVSHYNEQVRRVKELPEEFEEICKRNEAHIFTTKQRGKKLKVVMLTSDNPSLTGYLRSGGGGGYDVVAQWMVSGHVNVITRQMKRIDLRPLAAIIRIEEARKQNMDISSRDDRYLTRPGKITEVMDWYYDPATNSLQNGGINPTGIHPTRITAAELLEILRIGLEWQPATEAAAPTNNA